jgi:hypothetical protein
MSYNYHYVKFQVILAILLTLELLSYSIPFRSMPSWAHSIPCQAGPIPFHAKLGPFHAKLGPFHSMPSWAHSMPSQAGPSRPIPCHSMQICQVKAIAGKRRFAAFCGGKEGQVGFPETQNAHRPLLSNNQCLRKISYIMRGLS